MLDQDPGAVALRVDLAFALLGAAAGAIEQAFGALGDRADAAGFIEEAVAPFLALLHSHLAQVGGIYIAREINAGVD